MSATLDRLKAARAKIAAPEAWTQKAYQRDKDGRALSTWDSDEATCWCARGALWSVNPKQPCADAFRAIERETGGNTIVFNDSHTHAEVLAAFDRAIAAEEAR